MFNPNVDKLVEPPIPLALSWAKNYDNRFGSIIDMSKAVPSYPPHPNLMKYFLNSSNDKNLFSYGEIEGELILRENYASHLSKKYLSEIQSNQIHITSGCNQAFVSTILCLAKSGDEIMLSNPGYFSHDLTLKMLGIKSNFFDLDSSKNFNFDIEIIEKNFNKNVKAIVLVSPNNPTGTVYNSQLLENILSFCINNKIFLILDETYRDFIFPNQTSPHSLFQVKDWHSNLIQLYSFSKSCCIPGHRLGAITASPKILTQVSKVIDNIQICAPRLAQFSIANFLPELDADLAKRSLEIGEKASLFKELLIKKTNWKISSIGAFFAYVKHPFENHDCSKIGKILAEKYGLISIPGSCFGTNQKYFLRMSIAGVSKKEIEEVPNRLNDLNKSLNNK